MVAGYNRMEDTVDSFQVDTILFLVTGFTMIAITLAYGYAMTVEQMRASAKERQAASRQTSDLLAEKEESKMA